VDESVTGGGVGSWAKRFLSIKLAATSGAPAWRFALASWQLHRCAMAWLRSLTARFRDTRNSVAQR